VLGDDDILVSLPTRTPIIFTHDGRALIIQATREKKTQLFLRALDNPEARAIVGTEDARSPFLSPDGRWIGFIAVGEVKRVSVEGGVPTTICPAPPGTWGGAAGATWGLGGDILLGSSALPSPAIWRVPASGGTPVPITDVPQSNRAYTTPYFLEDGRRFLFSDVSTSDASDARLMVGSVDGGAPRVVLESATDARLLPNGQLVFMRLGTLMTARFDQRRAEVMGAPVAVMSSVMQSALRYRAGSVNTGAGMMYAFSRQGTLAAIRGDLAGAGQRGPLLWVTKDGRTT
jgi:hypothetical protein